MSKPDLFTANLQRKARAALIVVATFLPSVAVAEPRPAFVAPIDCPADVNCYIQQLVDRDVGAGARDFACGPMTYDGHQGTDFRVATMAEMRRGVDVVAAAPGTVRALRDGQPDTGSAGMTKGMDCGNGVVIDHADGWSTQYCHLAQGSVAVRRGQTVAAGEKIGRIGFSGRTDFPHVHLTIRQFGVVVDPFDGRVSRASCSEPDEDSLWKEPVGLAPGGVVDFGAVSSPPTIEAVREGEAGAFDPTGDYLVIWARFFGIREGDVMALSLYAPNGATLAETGDPIDRNRAEHLAFIGKKRPDAGWPNGTYRGDIALIRDGVELEREVVLVTVDR